jgi:branched-chain amino acid transport system permease protein
VIRNNAYKIVAIALLLFVPLLFQRIPFLSTLIIVGFYYSIVASNWNLLFGHAGIWAFGQLAFFSIGAYSSALLSLAGISPWLTILLGIIFSCIVALIVSLITLRVQVNAVYFALTTLGLQEVVRGMIIMFYPTTIYSIPQLQLFGLRFSDYNYIPYYYMFLLIFLISYFVHIRLFESNIGYSIIALRDSELRSISLGVDPFRIRTILFLVTVIFTSITGSLYAFFNNAVAHSILGYDNILIFVIIMAFGGLGTFLGPIISSFFWVFLDFILHIYAEFYRLVIMGIIVILTLVYTDKGLSEIFNKVKNYFY